MFEFQLIGLAFSALFFGAMVSAGRRVSGR